MTKLEKNNINETSNIQTVLDKINNILKNTPWLRDIFEYVYWYEKLNNGGIYNTTIFQQFLWISKNEISNFSKEELLQLWQKKIQKLLKEFYKIKNLLAIPYKIKSKEDFIKTVVNNALDFYITMLQILHYGLLFEIEKTNLFWEFPQTKRIHYLKEIENLERKLFGPKVSENIDELKLTYNYINNLLNQNRPELTNEERKIIKELLKFISSKINFIKSSKQNKNNTKQNSYINKLNKKISSEELKEIFKLIFEIYWINKPIILDDDVSNIYDSEEKLILPKKQKYSISKLLELIAHEIETHYITKLNHKKLINYPISDSNYLTKEEGLAVILQYYSIHDEIKNLSINFPLILAAEFFTYEKLKLFLSAYKKLTWRNINIEKRIRRIKRNYPFDLPWCQHKDTTYTRWLNQIINWIESWYDRRLLFAWKFNFETIKNYMK